MFFGKKIPKVEGNVAKKSIKSMDAVVTGVILGGIVASLYGVKKLREKDGHTPDNLVPEHTESPRKKSWIRRLFGR